VSAPSPTRRLVLMGDPSHFSVKGGANPHTRTRWGTRRSVDRALAQRQWARLRDLLSELGVRVLVVPGSQAIKHRAEEEGLDRIFRAAGFDWRESGCSMCLGMNPDTLKPGERCASTSNRNFEGRQGKGGRTHLVSPLMAAAAALEGRFVDIRQYDTKEDA